MPANTTNFRFNGTDLAEIYVAESDYELFYDYLNSAGRELYGNGLYAWGGNLRGQLGLGDRTFRSSPTQVGTLNTWTSISIKDNTTAAIRADNTLWTWGLNDFGQLGLGDTNNRSSPVQVGSLSNWEFVSAGIDHVLAIKTDGTLWAWGNNQNGKLGDFSTTHRSSPVLIASPSGSFNEVRLFSKIAAGYSHSAAIESIKSQEFYFGLSLSTAISANALYTWGDNSRGQLGQGNLIHRSSPNQITETLSSGNQITPGFKDVACGNCFTIAVKDSGYLYASGNNFFGQLGLGSNTQISSLTVVSGLSNWDKVACGENYVLSIKTDGTLWAWGENNLGQLGLGDITHRSSPVQVGNLTNWKSIACLERASSFAIKTDGTLWSWGQNDRGQLGQGDTTHRSSPVQIGALTTWRLLSGALATER